MIHCPIFLASQDIEIPLPPLKKGELVLLLPVCHYARILLSIVGKPQKESCKIILEFSKNKCSRKNCVLIFR